MEEKVETFAELFGQNDTKKLRRFSPGQKITATIVGISGESTFLDIGSKSEGVMNTSELRDKEGNLTAAVGERVEVYYLQSKNTEHLFTTKVSSRSTAHLEEAWRSGIPVSGTVKAEIKGGFEITLGGNTRAFCPYSQMSLRRLTEPAADYIGSTLTFKITRYSENGRNIVLSARALLEEEQAHKREQLKATVQEGQTVQGVVTSIRDFGVFVDIGGAEGLIPLSEIGWSRTENAADFFQLEQQVSVVIKKLDWENSRISLSYKETQDDPWLNVPTSFPVGSQHTGTISRLAQFGAFVTLAPGIDGLVHVSKLGSGKKIHHPREVVEVGQNIDVKVDEILLAERRISLAPADYISPEKEENSDREEYSSYLRDKRKKESVKSADAMGSLGALLQAKITEKKQRK